MTTNCESSTGRDDDKNEKNSAEKTELDFKNTNGSLLNFVKSQAADLQHNECTSQKSAPTNNAPTTTTTSESFFKNMTNNQLDILETRKSSLIYAKINSSVEHELDSGGKNKQALNKTQSRSVSANSLTSDSNKSRSSSISSSMTSDDDDDDETRFSPDHNNRLDSKKYDKIGKKSERSRRKENIENDRREEGGDDDVDVEQESTNENESSPKEVLLNVKEETLTTTTAENKNFVGKKSKKKKNRCQQRFNPLSNPNNNSNSGQNSSSILINGKRYYRKVFSSFNCGFFFLGLKFQLYIVKKKHKIFFK